MIRVLHVRPSSPDRDQKRRRNAYSNLNDGMPRERRRPWILTREAGLSTVEILAGIAIFALVAAGSMVLSIGSMKATTTSRQATAAATLIYDKVDQLRSLDPAASPADLAAGTHSDPLNPLTENGQTGGRFTRTWSVSEDSPEIGLSEVVITVQWDDYGPRSVRGTTYVCRRAACS
jgi:type II secretory pathway pseudopilin PulG